MPSIPKPKYLFWNHRVTFGLVQGLNREESLFWKCEERYPTSLSLEIFPYQQFCTYSFLWRVCFEAWYLYVWYSLHVDTIIPHKYLLVLSISVFHQLKFIPFSNSQSLRGRLHFEHSPSVCRDTNSQSLLALYLQMRITNSLNLCYLKPNNQLIPYQWNAHAF